MFHNCIEHLRTAVFLVSSVIPTMNTKNDLLNNEEIVFRMLELLKSNGTFDEFRRHCISDIDAKVYLYTYIYFSIQFQLRYF